MDVSACLITTLEEALTGTGTLRDAANVISPSTEQELLSSRHVTDEMEFLGGAFMRPPSSSLKDTLLEKRGRCCFQCVSGNVRLDLTD